MKRELPKKAVLLLIVFAVVAIDSAFSQNTAIRPVIVEEAMPDFTLSSYQGGEVKLSSLKGKNILLLFPRGLAGNDHWCHVCNYQYAELVELEEKRQIRKQYDLEILFVLPYGREMVEAWLGAFEEQLTDIKNWRNPPDPANLNAQSKRRMQIAKTYFPKDYMYEKGKVPTPFPILIDGDRTVTGGLGIFTSEWSGSKVGQNIPTILILDKEGTVQFKYMSQNTFDRPGADYLMRFIETMSQ